MNFNKNIFTNPENPSNYYRRDHLNYILEKNKKCKLIVVSSPAGYGKTTLLSDFISKTETYKWITIDETIVNQNIFFEILLKAFTSINDNYFNKTKSLFLSYLDRNDHSLLSNNSIESLLHSLINEFCLNINQDFNLVFDDAHIICNNHWAIYAFNILLKKIPDNLHIYMTTRSVPDLEINDLINSKNYFEFNVKNLSFSQEDISGLISSSGININTQDLEKLNIDNLSGWVTGINLTVSMMKNFNISSILPEEEYPENTFNLLAGKMFDNFDDEKKNFLLRTSLTDNFNKELCLTVLGIKNYDVLSGFFDINFPFIAKYKNVDQNIESEGYRYINLMRNYLRTRAFEEIELNELHDIYSRLSEYFYKKSNLKESLYYLELSNNFDKLYLLIKLHYDEIYKAGYMELLWKWLNIINENTDIKDPYLLFYIASLSRYYEKDFDKTEEIIKKCENLYDTEKDKSLLVKLIMLKSDIYINNNLSLRAVDLIKDNLKNLSEKKDLIKINYKLAFAYFSLSDYKNSESIVNDIIEGVTKEEVSPNFYECYNLLGHINLIRGDFQRSLLNYNMYYSVIENIIVKFETLCNLVMLYSQFGDKSNSEIKLRSLKEIYDNYPIPVFKIPFLLAEQSFYFESGDFKKSVEILNSIRKIAIDSNRTRYIYLTARLLSDCYFYLRDDINYNKYILEAKLLIDKSNELENYELTVLDANRMIKDNNNLIDAEINLLKASEYYKINNLLYSYAQVICYLSELYYKTGDIEKSKKLFNTFSQLAKEKGYVSFMKREFEMNKCFFEFY